ncbi:4442_t:CDS:2 [Funneliformis geosporum]|uniref:19958_t:CDS:1 n=1 Tax=Funneliformis geosporum TaxID=1117311 RepID=A0A9W4SQ26_9GLOM|nr:4442_t:CDS:2 [Funneliformis geosporum]CAI2177493.1 19958_t:CDS:2 [Funneliformis geosporum]
MSQQTLEQSEAFVFNNMVIYPMNPDLSNTRLWLRNALANASYVHSDRVFRDVDDTLAIFRALMPKTETYTYDDGKVQVLLCLQGTIPITYRSTPYNIPVAFWIPTDYPMVPPIAFVVPTPSMLVRKSQYVDVSGRCSHHYLDNWKSSHSEESNLKTLCSLLQHIFAQSPPPPVNGGQNPLSSPVLQAYSSQSPTPPPLPPPPYQASSNMGVNRPRSHSSNIPPVMLNSRYASQKPLPQQRGSSHPPISVESQLIVPSILDTPAPPIVTPPPTTQNPELVNLQSSVYDKVKQKCEEYVEKLSPEFHRIMSFGEHLNQSQELIKEERRQLVDKETKIKEKAEFLNGKITEIDKLIEQAKNMPEVSVDDILCGTTIVYNQLAEDNAIEDATYYLGKALSSDRIDLNSYMKNIRSLAREQFMRRALIQKVRRQAGLN